MESLIKKYQQKFKRIKDDMFRWEELQSLLISQFSNASAIIQRLELLRDSENYGVLRCIQGIEDAMLGKQTKSLGIILNSIDKTMNEFREIVSSIEKMVRDGKQLVKIGSGGLTEKQLNQRIGVKPTLAYCLGALRDVEEMHQSEYKLKLSIVSSLAVFALKLGKSDDLDALEKLLVDQPNIDREEVEEIYTIIFAEEIV